MSEFEIEEYKREVSVYKNYEKDLYRLKKAIEAIPNPFFVFTVFFFLLFFIFIKEYKDYLIKRTINHTSQASRKTETHSAFSYLVKDLLKLPKDIQKVAPERFFRTARKIENWEEINRKRKITGLKGEQVVVAIEKDFFESIGRKDLAEKIRHVSVEDGDGLGYDILSFFENGNIKYIEVKSTTVSLSQPFYLSRNELGFLKEHTDDAFIYRVLVSKNVPQIITHSSLEVLEMNEIIPMQYLVKQK